MRRPHAPMSGLVALLLAAACAAPLPPTTAPTPTSGPTPGETPTSSSTPAPSPTVTRTAPPTASPTPTEALDGIGGPSDDNGFHPVVPPCDPYGNYDTGVAPEWNIWVLGGDPWSYDIRSEWTGEVGTGIVPVAPQKWWENASDEQRSQFYASTVTWATRAGSATAGVDFEPANGTFAARDHPAGAFVSITNDQRADPTESFFIDLLSTTGIISIGPCSTVEIGLWDDDFLTIDPVAPVVEGSGNSVTEVPVTLRLAYPQPVPVTVVLDADPDAGDTASDLGDIEDGTFDWSIAPANLHTIEPGQLTARVALDIHGDDVDEPDETFTIVAIASDDRPVTSEARATVTILDDDAARPTPSPTPTPAAGLPSIRVGNTEIQEGHAGVTTGGFPVSLSRAASGRVTVTFRTSPVDGRPAAGYPADLADFSGSLVIPAGQLGASIPLRIVGDTIDEYDEAFRVEIDTAQATVERRFAMGTIIDDDPSPKISIGDARGTERAGPMTFVVTLSAATEKAWSFVWVSADGTARNTVDFDAVGQRVDGAPGTTRARFTVPLLNDHVHEQTERFTMRLIGIEGADPGDVQAEATIVDDDELVQETGVTRVGAWRTVALKGASGGQVATSSAADAYAKYTFTGDYVAWIGTRGPGYGKAKVVLDGDATIVDLYAAQLAPQATLFEKAFPEAGKHTIRIVVLDRKNRAATGTRVDLDAVLYEK